MLEIAFAIVLVVVFPVVINKTTESGHFHWIKPHLRLIWTALLAFFSIYLLSKPVIMGVVVELHSKWSSGVGYAVAGISGAVLLCGYWWMAGRMLAPVPVAPSPEAHTQTIAKVEPKTHSLTSDEATRIADASARKALEEMKKTEQSHRPTKAELISRAQELTGQLRNLQRIADEGDSSLLNRYRELIMAASKAGDKPEASRLWNEQNEQQASLRQGIQMQFDPLRSKAINLERDLLEVLPPQPKPTSLTSEVQRNSVRILLDSGMVSGAHPLSLLANYIEVLAGQLR